MSFANGDKIGELVFITYDKITSIPKGRKAIFNCSCGKRAIILFESDVLEGKLRRCKTCLAKLKSENFGVYSTWKTLINHHDIEEVGSRWFLSFENFLKDMGIKPNGSIFSRKDKSKPFSIENCKWGTRQDAMYKADNVVFPGAKINLLTVLEKDHSGKRAGWYWKCRCDCGNLVVIKQDSIKSGNSKSCGCLAKEVTSKLTSERNFKHGLSGSKVYHAYNAMLKRCYLKTYCHYHRYGGRGITVSDPWRESFNIFLSDMGIPPTSFHSLDRIDNEKGHYKENCRWATKKEQARNRSKNKYILYLGRKITQAEFLETTLVPRTFMRNCLGRGISPEEVVKLNKKIK